MIATSNPITESYESLVGAGQTLARSQDKCMWGLGDLGSRVQTRYGEETFELYAKEIGVPVKRLYSYARVYSFHYADSYYKIIPPKDYPEFPYWSHYRESLRLGDVHKAREALDKADRHHWSVEKFGVFITRYLRLTGQMPPAQPPAQTEAGQSWDAVIGATFYNRVTVKLPNEAIRQLKPGMRVRVVIE